MKKIYLLLGMLLSGTLAQAQAPCGTTISTYPYFQNFESGAGGWVAGGTASSWALGAPAGTVINSAGSGTNSWVTNLAGSYNNNEQSQVESPCFNLTSVSQPVISMKIWWNMENNFDKAALQSSIDGGLTWQHVGALNDPNNWYNNNSTSGPGVGGGIKLGWSGRNSSSNGSNGWVTAKHALTGLGGQASVRLRIAFGTDGSGVDDGFAFDDVSIFQTPANDVGIVALTSPVLGGCGFTTTENVCITITNFGTAATTTFPVSYTLNSGTPVTETVTAPIAPGATATYCFTAKANMAAGGTYNFTFTTALPNDGDPSNNTLTRTIVNPLVSTFPHIQDFQSATVGAPGVLPAGWSISSATTSTFRFEVENDQPSSGTGSGPAVDHTTGNATTGRYVYTESSNGAAGDIAYLNSPCINLAGLTTPGFDFWYHMHGATIGTMEAQVSSNGGTTWTTLTTLTGPQQTANTDPWLKRTVSLAGHTGIVQVRFKATRGTSFTGDMAIDDIKFYNIPAVDAELLAITAPAVAGCGFTATENVTISIKNNGNAAITSIPVRYKLGTNPDVNETAAITIAPGATGTYTFTTKVNLTTPGTYTLTTTALLPSDGDPSNDVKTRTINVIPNVATFPYFQNFESGNGGWVAGGTASSWALGTPAKPIINSAGSGTNSWITNLTTTYNNNEQSFVQGPCFNFTSLAQPLITLKIWWNMENNFDKASLQSSIDGGATWQQVGAFGDPDNWYNNNSTSGPGVGGTYKEGWSGRASSSNGSNGWVTAKHALTGLGGQSSVLLRIAFGTDGSGVDDGFAFDDVSIFESPAVDLGVTAIVAPVSGCALTNQETVTITVKNFGSAAQTNIPVSYTINAGAAVNEVIPGPLAPNATVNYSFTAKANLSTPATYTIVASTNAPADPIVANNALTKAVTSIPSISTLPYTEGFENGNGGWIAGGTASSWALGTPAGSVINSAGSGTNSWVTNLAGSYNNNEQSYVMGPCFNLAGKPDPDFEMKIWWNMENNFDKAALQSSIDGGATWQHVGALNDPNNWYNNASTSGPGVGGGVKLGWSGRTSSSNGSNGWVTAKHRLDGLGGQSSVLLRIAFGSDGSGVDDGFAFDDIRIGDNTNNLGINSFVPLTQLCGFGTNEKVEVVIENLGSTPVTGGYTLSYTVNNGTTTTGPFSGGTVPALAPNTPVNYTFPIGANISAAGTYTIVVTINNPNDPDPSNNTITYTISNATFTSLPPVFNFETPTTGIAALRAVTRPKSTITEGAAASRPLNGAPATSTKGMIMEATSTTGWVVPVGITDPWTNNPDFFSAVYICFNPAGGNPNDPLWLSFDLKQVFKTANANTNFRVTVNGTPVGGNQVSPANTYRPPFNGTGGTTDWTKVNIDLTAYKGGNIQIGLESSVAEPFAAGAGTANLVDNIRILRSNPTGVKDNVLARSLSVYPNPSAGLFTVSLPSGKAFEMEVTDLTGKTIMKQTVKGNTTQLDLKTQAQGVYMLKITSEGASAIQKLIIQ